MTPSLHNFVAYIAFTFGWLRDACMLYIIVFISQLSNCQSYTILASAVVVTHECCHLRVTGIESYEIAQNASQHKARSIDSLAERECGGSRTSVLSRPQLHLLNLNPTIIALPKHRQHQCVDSVLVQHRVLRLACLHSEPGATFRAQTFPPQR